MHEGTPAAKDRVPAGLPREAYVSDEYFRIESDRIFSRHWTFVAFAHELSAAGDIVPVSVAGQPVLLVRQVDGQIKGFHNVCSHRGLKLFEEKCRITTISCPYHAWCYAIDGQLLKTPHFGGYRKDDPNLDKSQHGLKEIRCGVWNDWIFINLDGRAPSLEEFLQPLLEVTQSVDLSGLDPLRKLDLGTVRSNWKFLMENFIEPYHAPIVHARSAPAGQGLDRHYNVIRRHCLGAAVDVDSSEAIAGHIADRVKATTRSYLTLFPNFVIGIYPPSEVGVHLNLAIAPNITHQYRVIYGRNGAVTGESLDSATERWTRVHKEDHVIVERLQEGRASSVTSDGGLISYFWEASMLEFQNLVRKGMESNERAY